MSPFGSGVLAVISDKHFIITASHVTNDWSDSNPLYLRISSGYISLVGELRQTDLKHDEKMDLAYIILDDKVSLELEKSYKFLPLSKFRRHLNLLFAGQYCVLGFPVKNQKIEDGKLRTGASFLILQPCSDKVYDNYKFDKRTSFLLEMKGKGTDIKSGEKKKITGTFHGISGCGIWLLLLDEEGSSYNVDYRLIGIITEYRKGTYYCLCGNNIEHVLIDMKNNQLINYREIPVHYTFE